MCPDTSMPDLSPQPTQPHTKTAKSHSLFTSTIKSPSFAYAHLELVTDGAQPAPLDNLQVRSYCTAALRQFLGEHGVAVAIDILKVDGRECWLRLPRQDLGMFSAAVTAFPGVNGSGGASLLRLLACGDWLGSLVGRADERKMWTS